MIAFRITHNVKPGSVGKLVELLQEFRDHPATQGRSVRIYTTNIGPSYTVIWEQEFESEAARQQVWAEFPRHPMASTLWDRIHELVEGGGSREIWNLR